MGRHHRKSALAASLAVALALLSPDGHAQDAKESLDPDKLFADAMTLVAEERYAEAIPKLEEAQRIDPGIGTQYNLAICYAKAGRLARAWKNFRQVQVLAGAAGKKERAEAARLQLEELRPRVAHLTFRVAEPTAVTVRIDGQLVGLDELPFAPLDLGEHRIEAVAAGRKPFEQTLTLDAEGESIEVVVPVLTPLETRTEILAVAEDRGSTTRTLGYVFGSVGLVGIATATVTGILILSDKSTAEERCKPDCVTVTGEVDTTGADAVQRGKTLLPINVVAWVVAGVGLGAGGFFLLTAAKKPAPKAARTTVVPSFDGRGGGALVTTTF